MGSCGQSCGRGQPVQELVKPVEEPTRVLGPFPKEKNVPEDLDTSTGESKDKISMLDASYEWCL